MTGKKRKSSYKDAHHGSNYPTCHAPNNFAPLLQTSTTHLHFRMDNVGTSIVSSDYIDIGDNNFFCKYCHATFWYDERVKYLCTSENLQYNNCCNGGKVVLPNEPEPPDFIQHLFKDKHFLDNIRAYNQMFSMTSFGAQIDESVNDGKSPYVFKISGQIYHWLGSLCPSEGNPPRFLQLYIYDTQNEVENRMRFFGGIESKSVNSTIVQQLVDFLDKHNDLVKLFRTARSICEETNVPDFHIRLYSVVGSRQYDLPTSNAIGAIVFGDSATFETDYDVVITPKDGIPQRVNKLHQSYMSLQFPLIFLYGQPGYHPNMKLTSPRPYTSNNRQRLSMNMYYAYQLHDRLNIYNSVLKASRLYDRLNIYSSVLKAGRLFQQYVVTAYCSIELDRIDYIRENQKDIRNDYLSGLYDAISRGDQDGSDVGSRIILPASFTGGPRYMYSHYLDALAICRVHGNPQFFITFTCNVKWPEIKRFMANYPELTSTDRADIVVRVFEIKVRQLLQLLRDQKPFGVVTAVVYTIEFQKRGLPHCHILLWIKLDNKISDAEDIDKYISAELPDPTTDPDGYRVVSEMMVHGPCGLANPSAPCTDNGTCKKRFPKSYNNATFFDKHGYVHYKRRNTGIYTKKGEVSLDNSYVVPYNRMLCLTFHAHINVEYCGWNMLIKYLFKYISKGTDRIVAHITKPTGDMSVSDNRSAIKVDEIQRFINARYICPHEACWRIFNFDIHGRDPAVQCLSVHLENMQQITYRAKQPLYSIVNDPATKKTTLTEWLQFNLHHSEGHHLTYQDFPSEFVWYSDKKIWKPRIKKNKPLVGRLRYIHPTSGDAFYLRLLLSHQKGCKSYEDIRSIDGTVFPTYRAACEALGLLGDDNEWTTCLNEASLSSTPAELRSLFAHILIFCDVSNPVRLWNTHWKQMADDIPKKMATDFHIHDVHICDSDLRDYALYELEFILNSYSKSTKDFGLPTPPPHLLQHLQNRIIMEEKNYDRDALAIERDSYVSKLNTEQKEIYEFIVNASKKNEQVLVFLYGHGGTGKTFIWKTIIATLRAEGKIVLAVASSGIASLLLPSGRTAHSRFKLPLDLSDESICNIKKGTHLAKLFDHTDLIIWDEAPMNNRLCFETLDRTLRDILDAHHIPFGGKSIMLGGDFRQTLPVIQGASKSEIINASIVQSPLWRHFKLYTLTTNMRLLQPKVDDYEKNTIQNFSPWLLDIGNGNLGQLEQTDNKDISWVRIPEQYCIPDTDNGLSTLVRFIYDEKTIEKPTAIELQQKVIVCPMNETTDLINDYVLSMNSSDITTYISSDEAIPLQNDQGAAEMLYPIDYLNTMNFPGLPPHKLQLKIGAPIILLRNLNIVGGLCNGTRMIVTQLLSKIIEAEIITGTRIGEKIFLFYLLFLLLTYIAALSSLHLTYLPYVHITHPTFSFYRMASTFLADLKPKDRNKIIEVKIYRTWIVRFPPNPAPKLFCCMLLDKAGNAIQATMSINDIEYFKPIVEVDKAYKISNFFCEETKSKQHPLPNPTTLRFGRATTFHPIPLHGFPSHHFNFVSYNQLYSTLEKSPILIADYIGCIQNVGHVTRSTDPNKNQVDKRNIDIINLNGNIVEFTMWDKMAMNFDVSSMPKPVMIAVTSCRVQQFQNQLQLSATQATHYYLNPDIEEVNNSLPKYKTMFTATPPLQVVKQKYPDHEKEKTRNRYSLSHLIAQNPLTYKSVRFTCEGSIVSVSTSDNWFQYICRKCKKKLMSDTPPFECRDDGLQPEPEISYCFRAIVADDTTTAPFVFFSPNADVVPNIKCSELVKEQGYSNPKEIPPPLEAIKGKRHIFQFHFNQSFKKGIVEFVFDAFLDSPTPDTGKRPTFEDLGKCQISFNL
ncbi:hypothetical protein LXL04_014460 [Taraxacum kok-saghyz]